jgi:hypothetical protein
MGFPLLHGLLLPVLLLELLLRLLLELLELPLHPLAPLQVPKRLPRQARQPWLGR